jgi:hypothetical protein
MTTSQTLAYAPGPHQKPSLLMTQLKKAHKRKYFVATWFQGLIGQKHVNECLQLFFYSVCSLSIK